MSCNNPLRGRRPRLLPSTGDAQLDARLRRLAEHLVSYQPPFMGTVTAVQDDTVTVQFGSQYYKVLKPKNLRGPSDGTGGTITPVYWPGDRIMVIQPEGGTDDPNTSNLIDANVLGRAPGGPGGGGGGGTVFIAGSDGNGSGGMAGGAAGGGSGGTTVPVFTASGGGTAGGATGSGSATFTVADHSASGGGTAGGATGSGSATFTGSGGSTVDDCGCTGIPEELYVRLISDSSLVDTITHNGISSWLGGSYEFYCDSSSPTTWGLGDVDGIWGPPITYAGSCSGTLGFFYGTPDNGDVKVTDS